MSNLIRVDRLGDINFGLPEDLAPHKKPWEYYKILGIERTATREKIRRAFGEVSKQTHPDLYQQGTPQWERATERQTLIGTIRDILCDDESELGKRFSKRHQYDEVSRHCEFFGDAHIEYKGERTQTMAEELFVLFDLEKKRAEAEHHFKEQTPEIASYIKEVERAVESGNREQAAKYSKKVVEKLAEREGISLEKFLENTEAAKVQAEKRREEQKKRCEKIGEGITAAREIAANDSSDSREKPKVFELWYNGKECGEDNNVTFGTDREINISYGGGHETKAIIKLGLVKAAVLSLIRQVHFKAQYADVEVNDAHLKGIIQIVNGSVTINYEGSLYGTVIRARAPQVTASDDFVKKGDLYMPKSFAEAKDWEKKTPDLDIAVLEGSINIRMQRRKVQETGRYGSYDYSGLGIILNTKNNSINKPPLSNYIINKFYTDKKNYEQ